jgi:hypothetical protein
VASFIIYSLSALCFHWSSGWCSSGKNNRKVSLSQPVIVIGIPGLLAVKAMGTYWIVPQAMGMS